MKTVHTDSAPGAIGPYSQAVQAGGFLYTSGQIALDPASGALVPGGVEAQTERAIANLKAILEAAGTDLHRVVKTTCFLRHMEDFSAFNAVYERYFTGKPARSCVEVSALPKGALVEIEAVAALTE